MRTRLWCVLGVCLSALIVSIGCRHAAKSLSSKAFDDDSWPSRCVIYLDMDGVVSDFVGQYSILSGGRSFDSEPSDWPLINAAGESFWFTMPWMSDGRLLWRRIERLPVVVMTSCGREPSVGCEDGKRLWVERYLGSSIQVLVEHNKAIYAAPGRILIDDRAANTKAWEDAGGIGIAHTSAAATLRLLENYRQCLPELSVP